VNAPDKVINRVVGDRYRLETVVGSGGTGVVWRAFDERLNRWVAVKEVRIPPTVTAAEQIELVGRALAEARSAGGLDHPNIVPVYDVVEEDGRPFIVMRLVRGLSLDAVVRAVGPLAPAVAARIGLAVVEALSAAHDAGIVHRDVKPQNILLQTDGTVLLTDFSIAAVFGAGTLTGSGVLLGSPGYIAPERLVKGISGPAGDIFGLGATLYYAVEGAGPFDTVDPLAGLFATAMTPHPAPVSAGLLAPILDGLLAKDPNARLTGVGTREVLQDLIDRSDVSPAALAAVIAEAGRGSSAPTLELADDEPLEPVQIPETPSNGLAASAASPSDASTTGAQRLASAARERVGPTAAAALTRAAAARERVGPTAVAARTKAAAARKRVAPTATAALNRASAARERVAPVASAALTKVAAGSKRIGPGVAAARAKAAGFWNALPAATRRYAIVGIVVLIVVLILASVGLTRALGGEADNAAISGPAKPSARASVASKPAVSPSPSTLPGFVVRPGEDGPDGAVFLYDLTVIGRSGSISAQTAVINRVKYRKSVRVHARCVNDGASAGTTRSTWVEFAVPGSYSTFQAMLGVDDGNDPAITSLSYMVVVDGITRASGTVRPGAPQQLMVPIPRATRLSLVVRPSELYRCGSSADARIAWGDALLVP
jgi:hypothetical protein